MVDFADRGNYLECSTSYDPDTASGTRCDHQWAGCFAAWPAQYILGLHRAGHRPQRVSEWIMGIAKLTDQGPFAQAYFAKDVVAPELGGAVKSFDALPQGNHWICSNGALYAEVVLEALLGASEDGSTYPWPGGGDYVDRDAIPGLPLNEVDHVLCVGVAHDPM